ncbi:hydrolase [Endozoicomonas sp.]|nr:hydrolase [Endozoicomonas sp.]
MNNNLSSEFIPWLAWLDHQHDEMLQQTIELAEINSGSLNADGVNNILRKLQRLCMPLGGKMETLTVTPYKMIDDHGKTVSTPLGNALRIQKRPHAPLQIFLCGHMDTVFPKEHPFQHVKWLDEDTINGPGVTDLKGGLLIMINALMALEKSPWAEYIGWEILFNPDEEIGSPSSACLLEEAAGRNDVGMIFEPSFPDGNLAGERKGSGNFTVVCKGKAAHAGREHSIGRNAVRAMSDFISAIDDLNGKRAGITINPAYINGGGASNIVPDHCISRFNIRIEQPEDEQWCLEQLQAMLNAINDREGIRIILHGGFGRKPKKLSPSNQQLFELVKACGKQLGMSLEIKPSGGCCDGNNLAAFGVPNIDTLGVQGGQIHSDEEYLKVSSLVPRAKLSALILMQLAFQASHNDINWLKEAH